MLSKIEYPEIDHLDGQSITLSPNLLRSKIISILKESFIQFEIHTCSPVIISMFKEYLEDIYFTEDGKEVSLINWEDPEWLKQMNIGGLYASDEFGQEGFIKIKIKDAQATYKYLTFED